MNGHLSPARLELTLNRWIKGYAFAFYPKGVYKSADEYHAAKRVELERDNVELSTIAFQAKYGHLLY